MYIKRTTEKILKKSCYDFDNLLIIPKRIQNEKRHITSRKDVELNIKYRYGNKIWYGIPIICSNMYSTGTIKMANELKQYNIMTMLHKFHEPKKLINYYNMDRKNKNYVIPSIGLSKEEFKNFEEIYNETEHKPLFLCVDIANGYMKELLKFNEKIKNKYDDIILISGNVATKEGAIDLYNSGSNIIKVGIGSGSVCTTRIQTGIGIPQGDVINEIRNYLNCNMKYTSKNINDIKTSIKYIEPKIFQKNDFHIISDGGCKTIGDICKSFALGADYVMLGGMFAGHLETTGEIIKKKYKINELINENTKKIEEKEYKKFFGMSSDYAQELLYKKNKKYRTSEGREVEIPYKGKIKNTIENILGGLRSSLTYTGTKKLANFYDNTELIELKGKLYNDKYENYEVK